VNDRPLSYPALEHAYDDAKFGTMEPTIGFMSLRTFVAMHIYCGVKYPRKIKKWAIGTRRSRRREQLAWIRRIARGPLVVNVKFEQIQIGGTASTPPR